jgi:hypothetical protein
MISQILIQNVPQVRKTRLILTFFPHLSGHYGTCVTACMDLAVSVARVLTGRNFCVQRTRKIKAHVFFPRDAWRGPA